MITITNYYSDDKIHFEDESRCIAYEYVLKQYKTKDDFIKAMEDFANEKFNESDEYEILISFDCWDMSSAPYNNAYFMNFLRVQRTTRFPHRLHKAFSLKLIF